MAKMVPANISSYNFTESEYLIYNLLNKNLSNDYTVYYSVTYHIPSNRGKYFYRGEVDFIILHADYGFICMEVKGGIGLIYKDKKWKLILNYPQLPNNININEFNKEILNVISDETDRQNVIKSYSKSEDNSQYVLNNDTDDKLIMNIFKKYNILSDVRILKKSPIKQASDSSDILKKYFRKTTGRYFTGRVGYCVCFPYFRVDKDIGIELADRQLIIDSYDISNIKSKIEKIFNIFNPDKMMDKQDYIELNRLINESRFYGITTSQEIKLSKKRLKEINRVQDFTLNLLRNYNKAKFRGGAGTGKTWIAMKKAISSAKKGMKTLLTCFNHNLAEFMKKKCSEIIQIEDSKKNKNTTSHEDYLEIKTFNSLMVSLLGKRYYELYKSDIDKIKLPGIDEEASLYINSDDVKYDAIIVDEAQDFSDEWQAVIEDLLISKENSTLYFFYDPYQNIFEKNFKNFLIAEPEYILTENLRNSKEIYNFAINAANSGLLMKIDKDIFNNEIINNIYNQEDIDILENSYNYDKETEAYKLNESINDKQKEKIWKIFDKIGYKTIEPSELEGIEPNISKVSSEIDGTNKLKSILNKLIKDNGIQLNQIIILSNRRLENSFIYKYQYKLIYPISYDNEDLNTDTIKFKTIQSFKGLESDVIIYLEHVSNNKEDKKGYDPYLMYVAYTRAKFVLEIISFDEK